MRFYGYRPIDFCRIVGISTSMLLKVRQGKTNFSPETRANILRLTSVTSKQLDQIGRKATRRAK